MFALQRSFPLEVAWRSRNGFVEQNLSAEDLMAKLTSISVGFSSK